VHSVVFIFCSCEISVLAESSRELMGLPFLQVFFPVVLGWLYVLFLGWACGFFLFYWGCLIEWVRGWLFAAVAVFLCSWQLLVVSGGMDGGS